MDNSEVTVERLAAAFIKIRDSKTADTKAYKARQAELEAGMRQIEMALLARAQEQGVSGFTIKDVGTTYAAEDIKITIASDPEFFQFVLREGDLEFFQRRPSKEHVQAWMKMHGGELPPGLREFRELRMRIRKAKADGKSDASAEFESNDDVLTTTEE